MSYSTASQVFQSVILQRRIDLPWVNVNQEEQLC